MGTASMYGPVIQGNVRNLNLCDFNSVMCHFVDPLDNLVNVVSGGIDVRSARYDPSDPDGLIVDGGTLFNVTTGTYGYQFQQHLEPGYYSIRFYGTVTSGTAPVSGYDNLPFPFEVCTEGQIQVAERTVEMDLALRIRRRLKDLNTRLYQLDLPVQKWPDDEIIDGIFKAVGEINATPPMATNYTVNTLPVGVAAYVVDIAFADMLESQGTLEISNTFTMNDGSANLTIQRAQLYLSQANAVRARVDAKVAKWKRSLVPKPRGQGTNQYPFQIRHVLSFLPNYKNIFGG